MSIISDLISGGAKGLLGGIGSLAKDLRTAITGVDPVKKAEIDQKIMELEFAAEKAQTDINLIEAQNPNWFISGWRPAVGWLCVSGLALQYIVLPFLEIFGVQRIEMDFSELITLLLALLGMGTLRTYEKRIGKARN